MFVRLRSHCVCFCHFFHDSGYFGHKLQFRINIKLRYYADDTSFTRSETPVAARTSACLADTPKLLQLAPGWCVWMCNPTCAAHPDLSALMLATSGCLNLVLVYHAGSGPSYIQDHVEHDQTMHPSPPTTLWQHPHYKGGFEEQSQHAVRQLSNSQTDMLPCSL